MLRMMLQSRGERKLEERTKTKKREEGKIVS